MADNTALNTMTGGDTIGADEISAVKYQRMKIIIGADGVNDGDISSANPMPTTFSGSLPAGTNLIGKVSIDQVTADANKVVTKTGSLVALEAGTAEIGKLGAGTALVGKVGIDQATANANEVVTKTGSLVALEAGTAGIGKLTANSGVDIGDVDITSIASGAINGPGNPTIDSYSTIAINLTVGADQVLASSAADKQIWVYAVSFTCSIAGTVSFQDEADTAITGVMDFAGNSGLAIGASGNFAMPIWKLATDKDLEVDVLTADIDGFLTYAIVSV